MNYAYYTDAFMGKGGIISLVDGKMGTIASLRGFMQPYTIVEEGPRGGLKKTSVVDVWMTHPQRAQIDAIQTRSDKPRPTFTEDGLIVYNRYWPPAHPTSGGEIATFKTFFARLVPGRRRSGNGSGTGSPTRRASRGCRWSRSIMVAEKFGTGRGTLFDILDLLFGEDYVVPCEFGELTGTSASARFNDRLANALFATVNEAIDEEGHQQTRRRLALRRAEERHRSVADGAAALRGEGAARLRAALGDEHDHRDPASRRGEAAARRPALLKSSPAATR